MKPSNAKTEASIIELHLIDRDRRPAAEAGRVGIIWGIRDGTGPLVLVTDCTYLPDAELYGDFLTHPRGHHEVWEGWRQLGAAGLARRNLPPLIVWNEYEHFPRGRVVFDTTNNRFTLYADRKLQWAAVVGRVLAAFGLEPARCTVRSDPHYRC